MYPSLAMYQITEPVISLEMAPAISGKYYPSTSTITETGHEMSSMQYLPVRAKEILAKPGFIAGADAAEIRDLLGAVV